MKSSLNGIVSTTFDLMRTFRHQMTCATKEKIPVNFLQMHGLALIAFHPMITMKELAEQMKVASPSATSFVSRLVKLGWIERKGDEKNRKLVRLRLTPLGAQLLHKNKSRNVAFFRRILGTLDVEERKQLENILRKLHGAAASSH